MKTATKSLSSHALAILMVAFLLSCFVHPLTAQKGQETAVPEISTQSTWLDKVVVIRLKNGVDVLEGLHRAVEKEGIRNAVIFSGIGSVTSYNLHAVANTTFPPEEVFYKAEGPYDLVASQGYIIDGRVHAHVTLSNENKAIGGHLEPGTRVFTFYIATVGVFGEGIDISRADRIP
jgi:predicted DNA-binding protein with PD1-like motif